MNKKELERLKDYVSPKASVFNLPCSLSFLDYFSGIGDVEDFVDGEELDAIDGE